MSALRVIGTGLNFGGRHVSLLAGTASWAVVPTSVLGALYHANGVESGMPIDLVA